MQSKMVLDLEKAAQAVAQAGASHADVVATGVVAQLVPQLQPGEAMPDVALLLRLMARNLSASAEAVKRADAANEAELADDPAARDGRDGLAATVQTSLVTIRGTVVGVYGADAATRLGFEGDTPSDPVLLASLGAEVAKNLPQLASRRPLLPGVNADPVMLGAGLADAAGKLAQANAAVGRERREAEQTFVTKHAEIRRHGVVFAGNAGSIEGLARLGGQSELARRVRPSPSRPGLTDEEVRDPEAAPASPVPVAG